MQRDLIAFGGAAQRRACPDHGHRLIPIHKVHSGERAVIGWTCPEPYCEHVVLDPALERTDPAAPRGSRPIDLGR